MNYRLPKKWCEEVWFPALLQGNFAQGTGELYQLADVQEGPNTEIYEEKQYCCLGVAAVACGIERHLLKGLGFVEIETDLTNQKLITDSHNLRDVALKTTYPKELFYDPAAYKLFSEWLDEADGPKPLKPLASVLAELNDNHNTFAQIVEWIKENVELYDETEEVPLKAA